MNNLNSLILEGNVVRQAEVSEPAAGFKVCKFPLAVNRFTKNSDGDDVEEVSFFDVEAYGKTAEICEKQSTKGRGIRVVGRLKQNRWKNSDGKGVSRIFVVAEHVEFKPKLNFENSEKGTGDFNKKDSKFKKENKPSSEQIQEDKIPNKSEEVF